ncbi:hypothetical protein [Romboutsia sp.]|uniref:hypothetical protein n=1 Tax=Romboutsia sp. TaxID=1965302 RepID=UPI002C09B831|nr:hypothetical protein [Romboutsia sp.]HSQ88829.1 hypothetical protein [Romboutsia sp.]
MKLEFRVYELTEKFGIHEFEKDNEFIKVGEEKEDNYECWLIQGVTDSQLNLIDGLNIQESAYRVPKDIVKLKGDGTYSDWYEFDIQRKYINMQIVEEIQRLNI